jgi:glutamate 5-kinase
VVAKIGSSSLTGADGGVDAVAVGRLCDEVAALHGLGHSVVLVSSGAIAAGCSALGGGERPADPATLQAVSAIGQPRLMRVYDDALARHGLVVGQVLLAPLDFIHRQQYLHARQTLSRLLELGVVPVVNENDATSDDEIRFGDNDRLAARVAEMVQADQLILLSDIDGLYTADPRRDPHAAHIPIVETMTPAIEAMGGDPPPGYSSGGMRTKLVAARIATQAGCAMAIAIGNVQRPLQALEQGARCTWFLPVPEGRTARKRWIAGSLTALGVLTVDAGAARALANGRSLLPAGVRTVEGTFERGDPITIAGPDGSVLGRGLSAYASTDADRIAGHRSDEIEAILGWRGRDEMVHRDDLVLG